MQQERERIREQLREKIAKAGQAVQIVHLTERDRAGAHPFMYTIGNYAVGLPELLIVETTRYFREARPTTELWISSASAGTRF